MALPEVAHIFPYSILNQAAQKPGNASSNVGSDFWKLLNLFWDSDRIQRWKIKIFPNLEHPNTGVQACFNLICLSPNAHTMWSRGIFAPKPLAISNDQTSLAVQFFWQPRRNHSYEERIDLMEVPLRSENLRRVDNDYWLCCLESDRSYRGIQSGQKFSFITNDPVYQPLPSWDLLEMQWILQRLVRMSGAADWDIHEWKDDSMNSISVLISDSVDDKIGSSFGSVMEWIVPPPLNLAVTSDR